MIKTKTVVTKKETSAAIKPEKASRNVFSLTSEGSAIDKMIAAIGKSSETLKTQIATCAAACVMHAVEHSDITKCLKLVDALSPADAGGKTPWRASVLREWFTIEGPLSIVEKATDKGTKKELALDQGKRKQLKLEMDANKIKFASALQAKPFWTLKAEKPFEGFDFDKELGKLLSKAKKLSSSAKLTADEKKLINLGKYSKVLAVADGKAVTNLH